MFSNEKIQLIVKKIKSLPRPENRPLLTAISGFGGSGKTTLADQLASALSSAYIVRMDDFIVKAKILENSWDKGGFDRERLEKQVLLPASRGQKVVFQKFLWAKNKLSEKLTIPPSDYLIVEGISVDHPDIAHYYDLIIWVCVDLDEAARRGQARDGTNENAQHWDLWKANDRRYYEKYRPDKAADIVIDN